MSWVVVAASAATGASSSTVAVVAIVSGAVVGVAAPLVSGYFQTRNSQRMITAQREQFWDQLAFERGQTDRAELRILIDRLADCLLKLRDAVALATTHAAMSIDNAFSTEDRRESQTSLFESLPRIQQAVVATSDQVERLRLRLGADGANLVALATSAAEVGSRLRDIPSRLDRDEVEYMAAAHTKIGEIREHFMTEALRFTAAELDSPESGAPAPARRSKRRRS